MVEELFVFLALGGAVIASVTDIKSRIIPNKLTFTLIAAGIVGYLANGALTGDFVMFLESVKSLAVMFALGYLFWMLGAWSAGDAKEFLFIAALVPVYPAFLYRTFSPAIASYPFIITVFVNTLLAIFPLVFLYSVYLSMKKKIFFRIFKQAKDVKKYFEISFVLGGAIGIASLFDVPILALVVMVLLYRLKRGHRVLVSTVAMLVYISPSSGGWYARAEFISTYLAIVFLLIGGIRLLFSFISVIREGALVEEVKITSLEEGAIIAEEIYIADGEVLRDKRSMIEKLKDAAKTGALDVLRRRGVGTGAAGVTEEDIELLKGYVENRKLEDKVNIKKSMPFAPVVLAGLVTSLVIGDAVLALRVWLHG